MRTVGYHLWVISQLVFLINGQTLVEQRWGVCSQRESVNTTLQSFPSVSTTHCATKCTENLQCMSGQTCEEDDGTKICSLSSDWPPGVCDDFTANVKCKAFRLINPCRNGGTLYPDGQSCSCINHWYNRFCQRYRYDCSEFDSIGYTLLQPRGSNRSFDMTCANGNIIIGFRLTLLRPGEMNRTHAEYEQFFATASGSGWIGLPVMHALTQQGEYRLTITLNPFAIIKKITIYDDFKIDGPDKGYSISYGTFRSDLSTYWDGFAANPLLGAGSLVGQPFSTYDRDPYGCAGLYGIGWWYDASCGPVLPWNPSTNRGRWPSTANTWANTAWMTFSLKLVQYY